MNHLYFSHLCCINIYLTIRTNNPQPPPEEKRRNTISKFKLCRKKNVIQKENVDKKTSTDVSGERIKYISYLSCVKYYLSMMQQPTKNITFHLVTVQMKKEIIDSSNICKKFIYKQKRVNGNMEFNSLLYMISVRTYKYGVLLLSIETREIILQERKRIGERENGR